MPKDKREVESGLETKGFRRTEGDHHYFVYWSVDGKKARAMTKTSHGRHHDISDELLSQMARQCGITKSNFLKLVDCPLTRESYEALLRQSGKL